LIDFAAFLEANNTPHITTALALAWAQRPSGALPSHWARRLGYVRVFARHRAAADPRTQVPPDGLLPFRPKRARPYLYSKEDIRRLLSAALEMPCGDALCGLRPWTYYCLFGLLSVSGLRLGEARNLKLIFYSCEAPGLVTH
jgi:integrase